MPLIEWYDLPWELFDAAQRQAVTDYGYETPEWTYVRDLAQLRRELD